MITLKKDHSPIYKAINYATNFDEQEYTQTQKLANSSIDIFFDALSNVTPEPFTPIPKVGKYVARTINNIVNQPKQRNYQQFQFQRRYPIQYIAQPKSSKKIEADSLKTIPLQIPPHQKPDSNSEIQNSDADLHQNPRKSKFGDAVIPITEVFDIQKPLTKQDFRSYVKNPPKYSKKLQNLLQKASQQNVSNGKAVFVRQSPTPTPTPNSRIYAKNITYA